MHKIESTTVDCLVSFSVKERIKSKRNVKKPTIMMISWGMSKLLSASVQPVELHMVE